MTFLTKLFEETPKKELQEFFKPNTIFLFENMSYEEVVSYFNTFKYKVSGGNSTERHILNNSEAMKYWTREYQPGWEPRV